jgi:leader peptidase (prepilin peptidase)/N-methyltransferase
MALILAYVYLIVIALLLGSFINLAADRLPRGESIIRPRSFCRACRRRLNTVDLLPVAGYVIRGGRCASCRAPIGISAPLVEVACGGFVLAPLLLFGLWPGAPIGFLLVTCLGIGAVGTSWRGSTR